MNLLTARWTGNDGHTRTGATHRRQRTRNFGVLARALKWASAMIAMTLAVPLAPAHATRVLQASFTQTEEIVAIDASFSFDGVTGINTGLNTFSGTSTSTSKGGPSGAYNGQSLGEYAVDVTTSCGPFTGPFGETEATGSTGITLNLVASRFASCGINGSGNCTFGIGQSGTGCFNPTNGVYTITETDLIYAGTGIFAHLLGGTSFSQATAVGFTLAAPSSPGYGLFQWSTATGTSVIVLPR